MFYFSYDGFCKQLLSKFKFNFLPFVPRVSPYPPIPEILRTFLVREAEDGFIHTHTYTYIQIFLYIYLYIYINIKMFVNINIFQYF